MADLITLTEYKNLNGITSAKEDTQLTEIIGSVSALIKAYCNNSFVDYVSTNKIQKFNNSSLVRELYLKETPLIEIVSVTERSSVGASYTTLTSNDYYYNDELEALLRVSSGNQSYWPAGPGAVVVTYKAGYSTLPEELKLLTANMVTYYFKEQYKSTSQNIASTSLVNNIVDNNELPGHLKRTLSLYRNIL